MSLEKPTLWGNRSDFGTSAQSGSNATAARALAATPLLRHLACKDNEALVQMASTDASSPRISEDQQAVLQSSKARKSKGLKRVLSLHASCRRNSVSEAKRLAFKAAVRDMLAAQNGKVLRLPLQG